MLDEQIHGISLATADSWDPKYLARRVSQELFKIPEVRRNDYYSEIRLKENHIYTD